MEGGTVGHNFEMGLPKDYPSQIWFNLVERFRGEDLNVKVYDVRRMDGRQVMPKKLKKNKSKNTGVNPGAYELKTAHISVNIPAILIVLPIVIKTSL